MSLPAAILEAYNGILAEELMVAMGCTEPIAIAYGASIARATLGQEPEQIHIALSGNIIKNVKSVVVPATGGLRGIEAAVAAGIVANAPQLRLEVLSAITDDNRCCIKPFMERCRFTVEEMVTDCTFDLLLTAAAGESCCRVHIQQYHTNVVLVDLNGRDLTPQYLDTLQRHERRSYDRSLLNVRDIVTFAQEAPLDTVAPLLQRQADMNMAIAREGLSGEYGAGIGQVLYRGGQASLRDTARALAAAGSDARMSGCEMPVSIISGSGNQGITASVPVVVYAQAMGADNEKLLRAIALSDLITIHQKTGIGCLSAYCGAISAGCGCGCGICFLEGGGFYEIAHTLVNAVAILSGTICDGAKPSCAAKIAMAVEAGIMGYEMMKAGRQFYGGDGIITKGVENTIRNIGRLARDGMSQTDKEIIQIMLGS
ncbi:MAG: serine dehydratase subunit alpha family protein [Oscillospiraceae bacterium]|nr:serine dehydratase subunit alpha family protein [Oscillospiraceae bacterium]